MSEKILVPVDGSEHSLRALDTAVDLAVTLGDALVVCSVTDINRVAQFGPDYVQGVMDSLQEETDDIVKKAVARVNGRVEVESQVATGNVVGQILEIASRAGAKWIVMGSHGRTGLSRLLMGSIAEGVLHRSTIPVMIVPRKQAEARAA